MFECTVFAQPQYKCVWIAPDMFEFLLVQIVEQTNDKL